MNKTNFFTAQKISGAVTRITDITGGLIYLVEGSEKALLLDTGIGAGDLAAYIRHLTQLPLEVVLTHGHMDHTAGASQFDQVYLNQKDWELAVSHNNSRLRGDYIAMICPDVPVTEEDMQSAFNKNFLPLLDNQRFSLGGITVEMLPMPGHTQGSMAALIEEEKAILFGDGCNVFTFIFAEESSTVSQYLLTLQAFKAQHEGRYETVYLSHCGGDVEKPVLDGVIAVCQDLLVGKTDAVPFAFLGENHFIARATNPTTRMRLDGGIGNVVYNPHRL